MRASAVTALASLDADRFVLGPSSERVPEGTDRRVVPLDPTERPQHRTVGARYENEVARAGRDDAYPPVDELSDESRPRVGEENCIVPRQRPCFRQPDEHELLVERTEHVVDARIALSVVDVGQSPLDDVNQLAEKPVDSVVVPVFRGAIRIDRDVSKRERQVVVDVCIDPEQGVLDEERVVAGRGVKPDFPRRRNVGQIPPLEIDQRGSVSVREVNEVLTNPVRVVEHPRLDTGLDGCRHLGIHRQEH